MYRLAVSVITVLSMLGCGGSPTAPSVPVEERVPKLMNYLGLEDYRAVYSMCSPSFRDAITEEHFIDKMSTIGSFMGTAAHFRNAEIITTHLHEDGLSAVIDYRLSPDGKLQTQRWIIEDGEWWWDKDRAMFTKK